MKNCLGKIGVKFAVTFAITLGCLTSAFAIDNGVVGTNNLNNTSENSATVGVQLSAPEIGWKRYDNTEDKILYSGVWTSFSLKDGSYNDTESRTISDRNPYYEFKFYGTKLRIISTLSSANTSNIQLTIDGVPYTYSEYSASGLKCALEFEKKDFSIGTHIVKVQKMTTDSTYFTLDAVDVGSNERLIPYDEAITLDNSTMNLTPGDTKQLTVTTTPAGVGVTWTSSDESVAVVDQTGKITSIKRGQATITATTKDEYGISASCVVNVAPLDQNLFVPITRKINGYDLSIDRIFNANDVGAVPTTYLDTDGTLISNSDTKIATQKAVKTYVDNTIDKIYPVGQILMTQNPANPSTYLGVGTWVAYGAGKVPVGYDNTQTEFDAIGKTGGEKTHKLTASESGLPAHTHTVNAKFKCNAGTGYAEINGGTNGGGYWGAWTSSSASADASMAHNNLQPYIVCYMWVRTA